MHYVSDAVAGAFLGVGCIVIALLAVDIATRSMSTELPPDPHR